MIALTPRRLAPVHPLSPYAVLEAKTVADVMRLPDDAKVRLLHTLAEAMSYYPSTDRIHEIAERVEEERREDQATRLGEWAEISPSVARQLVRRVL